MNFTASDIVSILIALGTLGGTLFAIYRFRKEYPIQSKKVASEADSAIGEGVKSVSEAAQVMLDGLTKRVEKLETDLSERDDYIESLEGEMKRLTAQFNVMEENVLNLRKENDNLRADNKLKDARIGELELRVKLLQTELDEYKK